MCFFMKERVMKWLTKTPLLLFAVGFGALSAQAQTQKWDMPTEFQQTFISSIADAQFADLVKQKSGGRLEITVHYNGVLGMKAKDHFSAVEDGGVPIAHTFTGVLVGVDPVFQASTIPFLFANFDEMERLIAALRPHLEHAFDKRKQILLFAVPATPVGIWSKVPIDSIDALRRLKIRTYDINGTISLKNAGATAVQIAWTDVVPALATGTINAVLTSDEGGIAAKFWEHTQHFTRLNFTTGINYVHVNKAAWQKLSPEVQEAVRAAAKATEIDSWARSRKRTIDNIEIMKKNGVKVADASAALSSHMRNASSDLVAEWKAKVGVEPASTMDRYLGR